MSVIDVLRPASVRSAGSATAVPSGTLAAVSADNNDATYIDANAGAGLFSLRMDPHTPASGYGRHQIRMRSRIRTDTGTASATVGLGRGTADGTVTGYLGSVTDTITELSSSWSQSSALGLGATTISDLNFAGGPQNSLSGSPTELRFAEVYVDVDTRLRPQYAGQIQDGLGVNKNGGTITNTTQPTLYVGAPAYDDLPPLNWAVSITNTGGTVFSASGTGTPPNSVQSDTPLADGSYVARFMVRSTIRGVDPFEHEQAYSFNVQNVIPPPSPPLLDVQPEGDGYRLTWTNPGGQTWDDDYVIAEVWRDDCTGSSRIAVLTDALNGTYLDLAIPQLDSEHVLEDGICAVHTETCDLTYRVRYWGYVSTTVTIPTSIPVELVIGWPGQNALIPSGWLRVTAMDGYYPRGATGTGAPTTTGGAASHSHTTPSHTHPIARHRHSMPDDTASSSASTTTRRADPAPIALANQPHDHTLPAFTSTSDELTTGATAPGTDIVANTPQTREVVWIRSDGSATSYPVGALAWSMEVPSGWVADSLSAGRYLKGAAAAGDGGATFGSSNHTHTVLAHTHTGAFHDHADMTTGLSGPAASTQGISGAVNPLWLGRHTHPVNVVAGNTGGATSATGGVTGSATLEPPNHRVRVLRNTGGGAQTRIIGLYTGTVAALPAILTLCNGGSGTPDLRGKFVRDYGTASVNTTGGASTHTHATGGHTHGTTAHSHTVTIGASGSQAYFRDTTGSTGNVPHIDHTHTADDTGSTAPAIGLGGTGTSGSASNIPVYREAHFVRLEGTVDGGSLATPEQKVSEYASVTVPSLVHTDGMDRIAGASAVMALPTTRDSSFPRIVIDSVPLGGGLPTVATSTSGEDLSLTIAVVGKDQIDALEALLSEDRVYWSPLGGTPGWFAPGSWSVSAPAPGVKLLSITMVRQPWPDTPNPEDLL